MREVAHSAFLSTEELRTLTGRKSSAAQRRWLDRRGWVYATSATGKVIVTHSHLETKLNPKPELPATDEPDWSSLDGSNNPTRLAT